MWYIELTVLASMELGLAVELFAITAIAGFLLLIVFRRGGKRDSKKEYPLPPGPRPWPILGNLALFGPLLHQDFKNLADKYGPIVYLRLGSVDAVAISSPELAEEVLKTKDLIFASRAPSLQGTLVTYNNSHVGFAPYGPYWRHARKLYTVQLMTAKRLQQFKKERKFEVMRALVSIHKGWKDGKAIQIDHTLWNILSSNICRMALGKTLSENTSNSFTDTESRVYEKLIGDFSKVLSAFVPGDFIPLLRYFDFHGHQKQMREFTQRMDALLEKIIEEHLQKHLKSHAVAKDDDNKDLVDVLLTEPALDGTISLSRDRVKGLLQEVLAAGIDTSIVTISWVFTELVKNPTWLRTAQEELDKVVGRDRLVEETDVPRLPYLQAIVKETFRLHPVAPLLVPHESVEATTLCDRYYIPSKCRVFVNTWAMGRDPSLWENPLQFNPERFLNADIDTNGQTFKFLPFGSGRRMCPGKSLALIMVEYSLAALLHAFDWALPDGMSPKDLDMTEAPGLTVHKRIPLDVVASPRLPLAVILDENDHLQ